NSNKLETKINLVATNDLNSIFGPLVENKIISMVIKVSLITIVSIFIILLYIKRKNKKKYKKNIFKGKRR
ncbi:MAG: D-alanyl-D-alanine carboxypeptidase, partial [Peptostreptococcaceae bacterium]|nr:D-alanyl-D-alanine carboxypeptidase [Peptostreptococcaceae bacterium]